MSDCKRPLEYLLEADPGQLRGGGDGKVSRNVRECERCADAATKVLERMASLDAALCTASDGLDVDALLRRANAPESKHRTATVTPSGAGGSESQPRLSPHRSWGSLS
jgi:hypothetical protein